MNNTNAINKLSKSKKFIFGTVITVISVVITLLISEIIYRFKIDHNVAVEPNYVVQSASLYSFNEELGYDYIPNRNAFTVRIRDGVPEDSWFQKVNSFGNIGSEYSKKNGNRPKSRCSYSEIPLRLIPIMGGSHGPIRSLKFLRKKLHEPLKK